MGPVATAVIVVEAPKKVTPFNVPLAVAVSV
jgi:hypothetical protein